MITRNPDPTGIAQNSQSIIDELIKNGFKDKTNGVSYNLGGPGLITVWRSIGDDKVQAKDPTQLFYQNDISKLLSQDPQDINYVVRDMYDFKINLMTGQADVEFFNERKSQAPATGIPLGDFHESLTCRSNAFAIQPK